MAYPLRPLLFALDAETAHHAAIAALAAWGSIGTPLANATKMDASRRVRLAGIDFPSAVGLAAGLDKDARAISGLFGLGFGAVEVGTLTPRAQPGNPRPRLFRLAEDEPPTTAAGQRRIPTGLPPH